MERYSIPENYKVVEFNGMQGLVKVAKDGFEKPVMECVNRLCLPAKSYGRIYIAYLLIMDSDTMYLKNYNGTVDCKLPIFDIRFSASSIWIRTVKPSNNEPSWCLLDKELEPVKYVGDFEIVDRYCNNSYYVPISQEYIEVARADGRKFSLQLSTGDMEEIKPIVAKKTIVVQEVIPDYYDIIIDLKKNAVVAIPNVGNAVNVGAFGDIVDYVPVFTALLGHPRNLTKDQLAQLKKEKQTEVIYGEIQKDKADKVFKLVRRIEHHGNAIALPLLYKYIKAVNTKNGNSYDMLTELNKELNTGFVTVHKEGDESYDIKAYIISNTMLLLVKNKNGRLVTVTHIIDEKSPVFDQNDILAVKSAYEVAGLDGVKLNISNVDVTAIKCSEEQTSKLPRPYSVSKRPELNSTIKSTYYERLLQLSITAGIPMENNMYEDLEFSVAICDGFCYIPKTQRNTKTVVAKGRTNNILVMIG